jgi:hypothetical protein
MTIQAERDNCAERLAEHYSVTRKRRRSENASNLYANSHPPVQAMLLEASKRFLSSY